MAHPKPCIQDFFKDHVQIDPESPSRLSWKRYGGRQIKGKGPDGYYRFQLGGTAWKCHRVIWCLEHGDIWDEEIIIDHINRDKGDNRLENLRATTYSGNRLNRVSGKGRYCRQRKEKWEGYYTNPGTHRWIYVGTFETEKEARLAALSHRLESYWVI